MSLRLLRIPHGLETFLLQHGEAGWRFVRVWSAGAVARRPRSD
jgi:hypothetical protein